MKKTKYSYVLDDSIYSYETRMKDILRMVTDCKKDPIEGLRVLASEILEQDLWNCFKQSRNRFEKFARTFLHSKFYSTYSDRFSIQEPDCLNYKGKSFDFSYIENAASRKITFTIHQDVSELLGLTRDILWSEYIAKLRIKPEAIVVCDEKVAKTCSDIKPLIEWRRNRKYKACVRAVKYLAKRVDEVFFRSSDRTEYPNFRLSLNEEDDIELSLNDYIYHKSNIRLARYRVEIDKTLQQIIEKYEQRDRELRLQEIKKRQQWLEAITSYIQREMIDNGDDEDIAMYDEEDMEWGWSRHNEHLLNLARNNGKYKIPNLNSWGCDDDWQDWLTIECNEVSAKAFYEEFIHNSYFKWVPDEETTITDILGDSGKTIHISLDYVDFDYSDATGKGIVTLKNKYKKYFRKVEPIIISCDLSQKIGIYVNRIFWLNHDTSCAIEGERMAQRKKLSKEMLSCVGYVFDTVRPLLSIKRGKEIVYFNSIDIEILCDEKINVSVSLGRFLNETEYSQSKVFDMKEDFTSKFNVWWRMALLHQVKWLKSEIASISSGETSLRRFN